MSADRSTLPVAGKRSPRPPAPEVDDTWTRGAPTHRCARGWIGEDSGGRAIPCLICKPHLRRPGAPEIESETPDD